MTVTKSPSSKSGSVTVTESHLLLFSSCRHNKKFVIYVEYAFTKASSLSTKIFFSGLISAVDGFHNRKYEPLEHRRVWFQNTIKPFSLWKVTISANLKNKTKLFFRDICVVQLIKIISCRTFILFQNVFLRPKPRDMHNIATGLIFVIVNK